MKIGLVSDTHSHWDDQLDELLSACDEVWHAGDIGDISLYHQLNENYKLRIVYGNIDGKEHKQHMDRDEIWTIQGIKFAMTHIAGYPGRYRSRAVQWITEEQPDVVVCGHSHILRVMRDQTLHHLHMNPGACGHHGFHKIRTILRFQIIEGKITDVEAVELGKRDA